MWKLEWSMDSLQSWMISHFELHDQQIVLEFDFFLLFLSSSIVVVMTGEMIGVGNRTFRSYLHCSITLFISRICSCFTVTNLELHHSYFHNLSHDFQIRALEYFMAIVTSPLPINPTFLSLFKICDIHSGAWASSSSRLPYFQSSINKTVNIPIFVRMSQASTFNS